ncbi:MAG: hypothetical protein AAB468_01175 [Patescibacteria group bacterium]
MDQTINPQPPPKSKVGWRWLAPALLVLIFMYFLVLENLGFFARRDYTTWLDFITWTLVITWFASIVVSIILGIITPNKKYKSISLLLAVTALVLTYYLSLPQSHPKRPSGAGTRAAMATVRFESELFYDNVGNNTYGQVTANCEQPNSLFDYEPIRQAINAAEQYSKNEAVCLSTPEAYAASIKLPDKNTFWCIDSTGFAGETLRNITRPICGEKVSNQ